MKIVNFVQGSPEWHQHRADHFNASDAPAMLGISQYKTRRQLLKEMSTRIKPDIDDATQSRFNDGHRFEALARPVAEKIVGDELSPVTGTEGRYSASFDGVTFAQDVIFEHKTLNDKLREAEFIEDGYYLPEEYRAQMEHQLMVSGAERCLFMASKFDDKDALIEERHCWYHQDMKMRAKIISGWEQFEKDLAEYQHIEHIEKPKAEAIMSLPALSVQATGMVTHSNLTEFKAAAETYVANINTDLQTDQQFADAEATVKFCKATEDTLEITKAAILSQTATIDEVIRTVDHIQAQLRDKRLMLDKLVKSEKENRKMAILLDARGKFLKHLFDLNEEVLPIKLEVQIPDFAGAIKGMKKLAAMQEEVDTALRDGKFAADTQAKDIRAKLAWCKEHAAGMSFLFPDLQQIITKPIEDFMLLITSRIKEHKEAEARKAAEIIAKLDAENAAKLEAERTLMRAQEEAKAKAAQEALLAAERTKMEADVKAKAELQSIADAEQRAQPEPTALVAKPASEVVIEHQAEIAAFMASRDFGKESGKVRSILVEFVKFSAQFNGKTS